MQTNIRDIKFSKNMQPAFIELLRERVNTYFKENHISKQGNGKMFRKTIFMFSLFLIPYLLMILNVFSGVVPFFILWVLIGFGMAGIGLSVMHDANHGSYSKNRTINKMLGYTLNLLGGNSFLWKIQHNYLHHAFTNIEHADDDINVPLFLRFSPHSEKHRIQHFQHIYVWFFYAISTLSWVTTKNFLQFFNYRKKGLIKDKREFNREITKEIMWKLSYYFFLLALPIMVLPISVWMIITAFIVMHCVIGLTLSSIFQPAHVMPTSQYPLPNDDGNMENSWAIHQLLTTSDFAPNSRFLSWFVGGLNFQNEHHLFPNICHIHYRSVSKIVKKTALEFNIPYNVQPTFFQAIRNHVKMLKFLGTFDQLKKNEKIESNIPSMLGFRLNKQT